MKDRLLYLTIGVLLGIVVMHGAPGQATVVTEPVGGIVALSNGFAIRADGQVWFVDVQDNWTQKPEFTLPIPTADVRFINSGPPGQLWLVGNNGDVWSIGYIEDFWLNHGQLPGVPVPVSPNTWGSVKEKYKGTD